MTQTIATPQGSKRTVDKDVRPFPKVNVPEAELTELRRRAVRRFVISVTVFGATSN
jgi:hypothetical protein